MKTYINFLEEFEQKLSRRIKKKGLTITVSGLAGAGKSLGARAIAKAFKLKYVSAGKIQRQIAKEKGITLEEQVKIRGPEVDYEMDRRSLKFAMEGNVVLDGRLTGWVAGDWADVKVWYKCPLKVRAERVARRDKISVEEAEERLKRRDEEDRRKYSELYGIDFYDESIYDVIVDNEKLTKEEAEIMPVESVNEFLKKKLK
jgi:cytidylate kinase